MVLANRHRLALHEAFTPLAGEEASQALLAEFPTSDDDELVTKAFLRAELSELRTELHTEIGNLRTELHTEIGSLRTDMARLEATIANRLRSQTVWMCSALFVGLGFTKFFS